VASLKHRLRVLHSARQRSLLLLEARSTNHVEAMRRASRRHARTVRAEPLKRSKQCKAHGPGRSRCANRRQLGSEYCRRHTSTH
jgi:hypothetical protein